MTSAIFDTCCGCIELRTGCLIIGYLNLVYSVAQIIVFAIAMTAVGFAVGHNKEFQSHMAHDPEFRNVAATATTVVSIAAIIGIIILLVFLTFNIVFVVGVHQNKRGHVKAYLIFHVIFLILFVLRIFASFANKPIDWEDIVISIFVVILSTYFLLVIRSHYHKMDDANRQPAIYNTA